MDHLNFSSIEKTISFYTRNDFAILNNFLLGNYDALWKYAWVAYQDNRGVVDEYENGVRTVNSSYDVKWLNCLRERLIDRLDDAAKRKIISTARADIANILRAMVPAQDNLLLFRTAWIDKEYDVSGIYPYSREYKAIPLNIGSILKIETISSYSLTPYRENEDTGSDFYRYEICIPKGESILPLDQFMCHNEDGEVLLPPMEGSVTGIRSGTSNRCRWIIEMKYIKPITAFAR